METEMKFDENSRLWVYKESANGVTVYGRGETQEEAKKNFEKNCDEMWDW
jgi:hypothetical protein